MSVSTSKRIRQPIKIYITSCSRGIHNAGHFYCALVLVFKAVCSSFGIALFTPQQGVM
nr:DUF3265 domain-containing protein [Vibrio diabolicus]